MVNLDEKILYDWFNNDTTISKLTEKYEIERKRLILLIRDNLQHESKYKFAEETPSKTTNKSPRKKWFRPDLIGTRPSFDNVGNRIWYGKTDDKIHHTLYMPHELKAMIVEEVDTGGYKSISEMIRIAISDFLDQYDSA